MSSSLIYMSFVELVESIGVKSDSSHVLIILTPLSSHVWSIISNEFLWDDIYSLIIFLSIISSLIITLGYVSIFLQINDCIKRTAVLNVDSRKVWIYHNIITIWCIKIILFYAVDVWVNSSTSPLLRNVQNLPSLFSSWRRKRYNYLF